MITRFYIYYLRYTILKYITYVIANAITYNSIYLIQGLVQFVIDLNLNICGYCWIFLVLVRFIYYALFNPWPCLHSSNVVNICVFVIVFKFNVHIIRVYILNINNIRWILNFWPFLLWRLLKKINAKIYIEITGS